MSGRKLDIIEYDDSTVVEIKVGGQWYRYEFEPWNDATESELFIFKNNIWKRCKFSH